MVLGGGGWFEGWGKAEVRGKSQRDPEGVTNWLVFGEQREANCSLQDEGNSGPTASSPAFLIWQDLPPTTSSPVCYLPGAGAVHTLKQSHFGATHPRGTVLNWNLLEDPAPCAH